MRLDRILDDGLDRMVEYGRGGLLSRGAAMLAVAVIFSFVISPFACALWLAIMCALEAWDQIARLFVFGRRRSTSLARAVHLLDAGVIAVGWVVLGCLVWVSGGPAAPVCAAAIWLSIIFFGQTYALESPSGLAVTGAVPAVLMLAIVAFDPTPLAGQSGPAWALLALAVAFAGEGAARGMLTRRRLADAQGLIIDSEARYRVLADNVTDAIALTRMDGKRLYISPSFEQLLGKSTAEILAEPVYQNVHPDDAERVAKYVESLGATGGRGVVECRLIHEDGTVNWVETSVSVTAPAKPGELGEVISVSRIINERKAMEARLVEALGMAEKAAAAKSDFLANMSHELRTPLNAIIGFAGLLEGSSKLDPGNARHAHLIAEASASLLDTVNSILDFSKFEAGSVELESRPFDPLAEAEAVAAMIGDQA
ncbi:MAG: histidine kinase dimerization/phospho-acceptor domain-containing protein, partial [Caulobacteraceae bacterium]